LLFYLSSLSGVITSHRDPDQNGLIEDGVDIQDYKQYYNNIIKQLFPTVLKLKISKRLKDLKDQQKMEQIKKRFLKILILTQRKYPGNISTVFMIKMMQKEPILPTEIFLVTI
jgi:hypothetical protein